MLNIYTDGACSGNPGAGGWAYIIIDENNNILKKESQHAEVTTNNKMELLAVEEALKYILYDYNGEEVQFRLFSDSNYVCSGLNSWIKTWKENGWMTVNRQPVKNKEYWKIIDELRSQISSIEFIHIKGHDGNEWNELVDKMAVKASKNIDTK